MIEKLESDTKKGCAIIGTPGIGKTFFGLYFLFYLTRRHSQSRIIWKTFDIMWYVFLPSLRVESSMRRQGNWFHKAIYDKDAFYLTDSRIPMSNVFAYTILFSPPRQERLNEFIKKDGVSLFYAPIWTSDEIWILWREHWKKKMTADRVQELLDWWGPIPQTIFDKRNEELDIEELTSKCNLKALIETMKFINGRLQYDDYNGKIIHIHPELPNFKKNI